MFFVSRLPTPCLQSPHTAHLRRPTHSTTRLTLTALLLAGSLSGCALWPKAWTWGSTDEATPVSTETTTPPPPAPVMQAEAAPKPSLSPVPSALPYTEPLEPLDNRPSPATMTPAAPAHAEAAPAKTGTKKGKGKHPTADTNTAKAAPAAMVKGFYINVGLFAVPANGSNAFHTLEQAELPVFTEVVQSKKGPLTRVRVGPYLSKALANAAAEKIKGLHLEAVVFQH